MRVLHVYSGNLYGGIEAILAAIARAQRESRGAVHEFALCFEGRLSGELRAAGACIHPLGAVRLSRPQTARAARQALARAVGPGSFDRVVCHAPWAQAIFGGVVRRAGVPLVFWAHDVMTGRHWTERFARRIVPDLAIANSRFTAATLPALYPAAACTVIYAPVERCRARSAEERRSIRASLDTPASAMVIVQASRSEAWKGHELLVGALAKMRDTPDWIWWHVGGAQRPSEAGFLAGVRRAAEAAGIADRVRWLGQRDDVPQLLGAADLYCQANVRPEPFGIVFVQALAAGLPVVTSDLGGAREVVDASCGLLVSPDERAFAGALSALVSDPAKRARLAGGAPLRARALCDPARQLHALDAALEQMTLAGATA